MFTIENAIYQILGGDTNISNLVSGRLFSGQIPQRKQTTDAPLYPAIAYRMRDRQEIETLDAEPAALVSEYVDVFSVSAGDTGEASRLDRYVIKALSGFNGIVDNGDSPPDTITIQRILLASPAHQQIDPRVTDAVGKFQFLSTFEVHYFDPLRTT